MNGNARTHSRQRGVLCLRNIWEYREIGYLSLHCLLFKYYYSGIFLEELEKELRKEITVKARYRIYVIYANEKGCKDKFLIGERKDPAWENYFG